MELYGFDNQESYHRQGLFQIKTLPPNTIPQTPAPSPTTQQAQAGQPPAETQITVTVTPSGGIEVTIPSDVAASVAALIQQSQAAPLTTGAGGLFSPRPEATLVHTSIIGSSAVAQHQSPHPSILAAAWVALPSQPHPMSDVMVKIPTAFMGAASVLGGVTPPPQGPPLSMAERQILASAHARADTPSQRGPVFTGGNTVVATISTAVLEQVFKDVATALQSRFPEMSPDTARQVVQDTLHSFSTSSSSGDNPSLSPQVKSPQVQQMPTKAQEVARQLLSSTLLKTAFSRNIPYPYKDAAAVPTSSANLASSANKGARSPASPSTNPVSNPSSLTPSASPTERPPQPQGREASGSLMPGAQRFASQPPTLGTPPPPVAPTPRSPQPPQGIPRDTSSPVVARGGILPSVSSAGTKNPRVAPPVPVVTADVETARRLPGDPLRPSVAPETHEGERTFDGSSGGEQAGQEELWQVIREELEGHFPEAVIDKVLKRLADYQRMIGSLSVPLRDIWTELKLISNDGIFSFTPEDLECFKCHMRVVELFLSRPDWIAKFLPEERAELEDLRPYLSETRELLNKLKHHLTHREGGKGYW